jgi:hypothetical protein
MSRQLVAILVSATVFGMLSTAGAIGAPPTLTLSTATDPAESIPTQLIATGTAASSDTLLYATVKPTGGQSCGANYGADVGAGRNATFFAEGVSEGPFSKSVNWTFETAGSYLLCGWLNDSTQSGEPVVATASLTVSVRQPHLALGISAPATVATGQTFQLVTIAQAEVTRTVNEYILPNTGRGCPANGAAASATSGGNDVEFPSHGIDWSVNGGPFSESANETLRSAGQYLVCAYVQYPSGESPPEITASAAIMAVAPPPPCVVPNFTSTTRLAAIEQLIRAGGCTVGQTRQSASRKVRAGYVIALSPASAQHLPSATAVNITISTGPPCIVPRVLPGTALGRVERRLAANHCSTGKVSSTRSRRYRHGSVLHLGARTGQVLASHAPVAIVVARARRH